MNNVDFTLLSDGSSDKTLLPIIRWLLRRKFPTTPLNGQWADPARFPAPARTLVEKLRLAITLYTCDVLFVHRDAESQPAQSRYAEINAAMREVAGMTAARIPHVCIVPVRMTEAWLLFNEAAIRKAAGNPNGHAEILLPPLTGAEDIPDPKKTLFSLLEKASGLRGRQKKTFQPAKHRHLIVEYINDFSPLLALSAFQKLRDDIEAIDINND
jgi:hypothetical protein